MRQLSPARGWSAAALALGCLLAAVSPAAAVDWCLPRTAPTEPQPCPLAKQCCAIWGVCGMGNHYCKQGHCAGGPCHGEPVILPPSRPVETPDNPFAMKSPSPPPPKPSGGSGSGGGGDNPFAPTPSPSPPAVTPQQPSPSPPAVTPQPGPSPSPPTTLSTCGTVQEDVDLYGADLPDGMVGGVDTLKECCGACKARPGCGAYTYVTADKRCLLKSAESWEVTPKQGRQSGVLLAPTPGGGGGGGAPPAGPPADATCGTQQKGIDLFGGDLAEGRLTGVDSPAACCDACKAAKGCGAYTHFASDSTCWLKEAAGFEVRNREGATSAVLPAGPKPSPSPSPAVPSPAVPSPSPSPAVPSPAVPSPSPAAPSPSPPPPSVMLPPPPPPPPPAVCGEAQQDVDLQGADIPAGTLNDASDIGACCSACLARTDCGAYTYVPWGKVCYLKSAAGYKNATTAGMQSAVITGRQPAVVIVDPTPPPTIPTPEVPGSTPNGTGNPYAPGPYKFVEMTADQKRRMYQLTSIFENSATDLQYGYAERLGDDRGITYGYCGFTTGTSDGLMVVEEFSKLQPGNPLEAYLPALRAVEGKGDSFDGLDGFEAEVQQLGNDTDFIAAQWSVCDKEYNVPAMQICEQIQCRDALTKAQLHDALVNHGQGEGDKFSVDYLVRQATEKAGGTPATGVDETAWLRAFLEARYALLAGWDSVAAASLDRVRIYQDLVNLGNKELDGPVYLDLERRTNPDGTPAWTVNNVHYGQFLIYTKEDENHRLELIP